MCDVIDEDTEARKDGLIALQLHAGPPMKVQFRTTFSSLRTNGGPKITRSPAHR